jgi:hypothetical protein
VWSLGLQKSQDVTQKQTTAEMVILLHFSKDCHEPISKIAFLDAKMAAHLVLFLLDHTYISQIITYIG